MSKSNSITAILYNFNNKYRVLNGLNTVHYNVYELDAEEVFDLLCNKFDQIIRPSAFDHYNKVHITCLNYYIEDIHLEKIVINNKNITPNNIDKLIDKLIDIIDDRYKNRRYRDQPHDKVMIEVKKYFDEFRTIIKEKLS